ncbi:MAG: DUF4838 domain-containing protein [Bacteroidales bacterium]|nr:DUF4838 domain-containing protein [Bacteroidales bacterium]
MKRYGLLLVLLFNFSLFSQSLLFNRGESEHSIVIPSHPSDIEQHAAQEMQRLLIAISGAELPILREGEQTVEKGIYIGNTEYAAQTIKNQDQIRDDGFIKYCDRENLILYGTYKKAALYAVYDFLEEQLGTRLYTPDALDVVQQGFYVLPQLNQLKNPSFKYREVLYYYPNHSDFYLDWHRLHNREDLYIEWGMFVHTFQYLIPVEQYFETHPEWFSEIHGRRIKDGQLCLSNPELLEQLCKNLQVMMDEKPDALYWSVSNNDNMNNCTCSQCRRLDSLYGAPSGTLLYFINQVAARFPDKIISTLAYQYTRKPPYRLIQPSDNVNIMFCSIECGRERGIELNPREQSFVSDMTGWKNLTDNIFLWDYVVQFRNMMNPFPNLHVLQPNLEWFSRSGVKMMFEQGTGPNNKTSWMELRTYLIAKLMWNVHSSPEEIMNEFIEGYYERAYPPIYSYFKKNTQAVIDGDQRLDIYGYPIDGVNTYLTHELIKEYDSLFVQAYQLAHRQDVKERIRYLELSHDFAKIELSMSEVSEELSLFHFENGVKKVKPEMIDLINRFVADCEKMGIKNLEENGYTPEQWRENVFHFIEKSSVNNLAVGKKIKLKTKFSDAYNRGGAEALIDGVFGILNYHQNWLGFLGQDFEAVVDLEEITPIEQISIDFYFYPLSWIFVPEEVTFYVSKNGRRWEKIFSETYQNPEVLAKAHIQKFVKTDLAKEARYIKIKAKAIKKNPEWHRGFGEPCWIFTDEIVIQ